MEIFPKFFGSLRSQQLNSQIIISDRFARIKFYTTMVYSYLTLNTNTYNVSIGIHYKLYISNSNIGNLPSFCDIISKHMYQ